MSEQNPPDDTVTASPETIANIVSEMSGLRFPKPIDWASREAERLAAIEDLRRHQRELREARRREEDNARRNEANARIAEERRARNAEINERIKNKADALFANRPDRRLDRIARQTEESAAFRNALLQEHGRADLARQYAEIGRGLRDLAFPPNPEEPDIDLGRDPITDLRKIQRGGVTLFD
jgi:hypothetical protein